MDSENQWRIRTRDGLVVAELGIIASLPDYRDFIWFLMRNHWAVPIFYIEWVDSCTCIMMCSFRRVYVYYDDAAGTWMESRSRSIEPLFRKIVDDVDRIVASKRGQ